MHTHGQRVTYQNAPHEERHAKIAKTEEEISQLLEKGFEYVMQKDDMA
jgi:hypothetical protein